MTDGSLRQKALDLVLAANPELASAADPESLARLRSLVDVAEQELLIQSEIEEARRRDFAEQARRQGEKARRQRAEAEQAKQEEEARLKREQETAERNQRIAEQARRAEELASMPAAKRWVLTHKYVAAFLAAVVAVVVLGITFVVTASMITNAQVAAKAEAKAAAEAEAKAAAEAAQAARDADMVACDISRAGDTETDQTLLTAWAECADPAVRRALAANTNTPTDVRYSLLEDLDASVAEAVVAVIGEPGPGGGIVFYDAGAPEPWGKYLEVAPEGWAGTGPDPAFVWCPAGQPGYAKRLNTGVGIGSGAPNTARIVGSCGIDTAAGAATTYRGGGQDDWFLPSKDELDAIRQTVGPIDMVRFWTSSQDRKSRERAWQQFFATGIQTAVAKDLAGPVRIRPVRAFGPTTDE